MLEFYDAIEDDVALARLCETLATDCGGRSATILHFTEGGDKHLVLGSYFSAEQFQLYEDRLSGQDPWRNQLTAARAGRVFNYDDLISREDYLRSEFYNEMFRAWGDDTGRCMGIGARIGPALLSVGVHRPLGAAAFGPAEMARLQDAFVHLARVAHIRWLFGVERARARQLEAMVAASGAAVLVVDRSLKVLAASPAGLACLDRRDGLACHGGALRLSDRVVMAQVRAAVAAAIDRTPAPRSGFSCRRPSDRPAYRLLVLPAGVESRDGALVVIDDPAILDGGAARKRWIAEAYGLTRAESALAECLLEGLSPQEIADRRGVAIETVRTQVKSLLAKTETRRQVELVALLSRLPCPTGAAVSYGPASA